MAKVEPATVIQVLRVSFLLTLFSCLDVSNTESPALERVPSCVLMVVTSSVVMFVLAYLAHSFLTEEVKWRIVSLLNTDNVNNTSSWSLSCLISNSCHVCHYFRCHTDLSWNWTNNWTYDWIRAPDVADCDSLGRICHSVCLFFLPFTYLFDNITQTERTACDNNNHFSCYFVPKMLTDNWIRVSTWLLCSHSFPWVLSSSMSFEIEEKEYILRNINASSRSKSLISSLDTTLTTCMTKKTEDHWPSKMNLWGGSISRWGDGETVSFKVFLRDLQSTSRLPSSLFTSTLSCLAVGWLPWVTNWIGCNHGKSIQFLPLLQPS